MILRPALHLSAGLAIAAALSGCALLSTPDPVQNYRFGLPMAAPSTVGDTPAPLTVSIRRIEFPQAPSPATQEQVAAAGAESLVKSCAGSGK